MAWKLEEKVFCVTTYIRTKSYKTVQTRFRRNFNFNTYPGILISTLNPRYSCGIVTFKPMEL